MTNQVNLSGAAQITHSALQGAVQNPYPPKVPRTPSLLFSGKLEVHRAANGYLVSITDAINSDTEVYIAHNVAEVNEIITTHMVAFRLEDK